MSRPPTNQLKFSLFAPYLREHTYALLFSTLLSVAQTLPAFGFVYAVRHVFERAIPEKDLFAVAFSSGFVLLLGLLQVGLGVWISTVNVKMTASIIAKVRGDLLDKLYRLSRYTTDHLDLGQLHHTIVQATGKVDQMADALLTRFLPAAVIALALFVFMIKMQWMLTACLFVTTPLIGIVHFSLKRPSRNAAIQLHRSLERFSQGVWFVLRALDLTHMRGAKAFELCRQKETVKAVALGSQEAMWFQNMTRDLLGGTLLLSAALVVGVGGALVINEALTLQELVVFYAALALFQRQMNIIFNAVPAVEAGRTSVLSVQQILTMSDQTVYRGKKVIDFSGRICLNNVAFSYDQQPVLREVSLSLAPGRTVSLTGANGSGKTTLVRLLLGFYAPSQGDVTADGHSYAGLDLAHLRRCIGVVPQDPVLFSGTIFDNIAYGDMKVTLPDVRNAAKLSGADRFIEKLPKQYESQVGAMNIRLSGGQKQSLALARALLHRPSLIILDEPGNHLDLATIELVMHNIRHLDYKPAVLLISHDTQISAQADEHYALQEGRLLKVKEPAFL